MDINLNLFKQKKTKSIMLRSILWIVTTLMLIADECIMQQCSKRSNLKEDLLIAKPSLKNCTYVQIIYPICNMNLSVDYSVFEPYVVRGVNGSNTPTGLLPDYLKFISEVCCHGCMSLSYNGPFDSFQKFNSYASDDPSAHLYIPFESAFSAKSFLGNDYIPFIKVPGVTFMALEMNQQLQAHENTRHMMMSVMDTWPLFITAILMAIISGCVMWVLDTWFNENDFPNHFPRGPFEGFWWAFVSMTTVGYGDRAPKSYIARIFAVIWIFLGITVFSMYTAILTTALNITPTVFEDKNFIDKKVAVLSSSAAGEASVLSEHAKYVRFETISDMGQALQNGDVNALALDNYKLKYYGHSLQKIVPSLKMHHDISGVESSYGVLSYNKNISSLLRSFFVNNEDQRTAITSKIIQKRWKNIKHLEDNSRDFAMFSAKSPIFSAAIIGLLTLGFAATVTGLTCKFLFKKNKELLASYIRCMEMHPKKDQQKEESRTITEFASELEEFKCRWSAKMHVWHTSRATPDCETPVSTPGSAAIFATLDHVEEGNRGLVIVKEINDHRKVNNFVQNWYR